MADIKSKKGFTLIELLVVISIISVLSSIIFVALDSARDRAKVAQAALDLKEITKALALYQADHDGDYPCFDHNGDDSYEAAWAAPYYKWPKNPLSSDNSGYHWERAYDGYTYPFNYSVSLFNVGDDNALALDKYMDDGNLSTGNIQGWSQRVEYGGIDQSVVISSGCV